MIDFIRENMAPLMFGGLVLFLVIGYPAAFSLAAIGLFSGLVSIELGLIAPNFLGHLTYQLYGVPRNSLPLEVRFFPVTVVILAQPGPAAQPGPPARLAGDPAGHPNAGPVMAAGPPGGGNAHEAAGERRPGPLLYLHAVRRIAADRQATTRDVACQNT